jgi:hypothetical protein
VTVVPLQIHLMRLSDDSLAKYWRFPERVEARWRAVTMAPPSKANRPPVFGFGAEVFPAAASSSAAAFYCTSGLFCAGLWFLALRIVAARHT